MARIYSRTIGVKYKLRLRYLMEKLIIEIERQSVGFIASAPELNLQSYGESL